MSNLEVKIFTSQESPMADIKSVYLKCSWGWGNEAKVERAMSGSFAKIIAYSDGHPVGFCRVIGDGVYALLVDTMVIPEMKRQGVGRAMMESLLAFLKQEEFAVVKLMSSEEGKEFYESFGFKVRENHEPGMMLMLGMQAP